MAGKEQGSHCPLPSLSNVPQILLQKLKLTHSLFPSLPGGRLRISLCLQGSGRHIWNEAQLWMRTRSEGLPVLCPPPLYLQLTPRVGIDSAAQPIPGYCIQILQLRRDPALPARDPSVLLCQCCGITHRGKG